MHVDHRIWRIWANFLQQWGIDDWAVTFLESAGLLTIIGAQIIYLSQPLLRNTFPEGHLNAMASLLEDEKKSQAFVTYLREAQLK